MLGLAYMEKKNCAILQDGQGSDLLPKLVAQTAAAKINPAWSLSVDITQ